MYSRADVSRTAKLVVTPFPAANALAREWRAADAGSPSTEDREIFRDTAIRSGSFMRKVE